MGERDLLRRVDTKIVATAEIAGRILRRVRDDYAAWAVSGGNVARYRSLYFDTPDLRCFHDHRRGRRRRCKVRIRHYPDRGLSFLEVKNKRSEELTEKHRLALPYGEESLNARALEFLRTHVELSVGELRPCLRVDFRRVGLVGVNIQERVTVDLDIEAERGGTRRRFGDWVVFEIKQPRFSMRTPIAQAVRAERLRPSSLSKYAVATALLRPELPRNRLLFELRTLALEARDE